MGIGSLHPSYPGWQREWRRWERAACDMARATAPGADDASAAGRDRTGGILDPAIRLLVSRRCLEAILASMRARDRLLGNLIDMLA